MSHTTNHLHLSLDCRARMQTGLTSKRQAGCGRAWPLATVFQAQLILHKLELTCMLATIEGAPSMQQKNSHDIAWTSAMHTSGPSWWAS